MQRYEIQLIQAIAQLPTEAARYLMSPQSDLGMDWFESVLARKFFSSVAELAISNSNVSLMTILLHRDSELGAFTPGDVKQITEIWKDALKAEKIELAPLVRHIKVDVLRQRADRAIEKYHCAVNKYPQKVVEHIDALGGNLALLSHSGVEYDPNPAKHLEEPTMAMRGPWGANSILDKMFSRDNTEATGGKPAYGLAIASMPTGGGKTTMGITMAAYTLAYSNDKVVIMSNELVRAIYATAVFRAMRHMYAGQQTDDEIKSIMTDRLAIYAPSSSKEPGINVNSFEAVRRILYWERPQFAVMDSINGVSSPQFASRMSEQRMHEVKAEGFRDTCLEFNLLMYAPGNMSEEHQRILKSNKPDKLQSVMLFGSTAYQNAADWCYLGWRDFDDHWIVHIKRTKNRHGTSLGERWPMIYDKEGGYYRPTVEVHLN